MKLGGQLSPENQPLEKSWPAGVYTLEKEVGGRVKSNRLKRWG